MRNKIKPCKPVTVFDKLKEIWQPTPLKPPIVDPEIEILPPIQRSAETIRYSILSFEFWISPNGQVREWFRQNAKLAAWIGLPAFLILPIVTFILVQFAGWVTTLTGIVGKLILLPLLALLSAITGLVSLEVIKSIFRPKK
jgi:hypothetical protein